MFHKQLLFSIALLAAACSTAHEQGSDDRSAALGPDEQFAPPGEFRLEYTDGQPVAREASASARKTTSGRYGLLAGVAGGGDLQLRAASYRDDQGTSRQRLSDTDLDFVTEAASAGMFALESSQLALQLAHSESLRRAAQALVDDHARSNPELLAIATHSGYTPREHMAAKHAWVTDSLRGLSGREFDREYRQVQLDAQRQTVQLFEDEMYFGNNLELRAFAERTLPSLRQHLELLAQ